MAYDSWEYLPPEEAVEIKWRNGCGKCHYNLEGMCIIDHEFYPRMGREDCESWKRKNRKNTKK